MSQSRFVCTVPNCSRKHKDYSLITMYEHLAHHAVQKGHNMQKYRCLSCPAFFTNRIFMISHLKDNKTHKVERIPLNIENPLATPMLLRDCEIAYKLVSQSFKCATPNNRDFSSLTQLSNSSSEADAANGILASGLATPAYARSSNGYIPRTPNFSTSRLLNTAQRTPTYGSSTNHDLSNSFANADCLPRTPTYSKRPDSNNPFGNVDANAGPRLPLDFETFQQFSMMYHQFTAPQNQDQSNANHTPIRERFDTNSRDNGRNFVSGSYRGRPFDNGRAGDVDGFRAGRGGRGGRGFRGGNFGDRDGPRRSRSRSRSPRRERSCAPPSGRRAPDRRSYSKSPQSGKSD